MFSDVSLPAYFSWGGCNAGRKLREGRRGADVASGWDGCLQVRGLPFKEIGGMRLGLTDVFGIMTGSLVRMDCGSPSELRLDFAELVLFVAEWENLLRRWITRSRRSLRDFFDLILPAGEAGYTDWRKNYDKKELTQSWRHFLCFSLLLVILIRLCHSNEMLDSSHWSEHASDMWLVAFHHPPKISQPNLNLDMSLP